VLYLRCYCNIFKVIVLPNYLEYFRGLVFGFFSIFCFLTMNEELARLINPQAGGPGDFWPRFSSSGP
jgi:hypothetical protein